MKKKIVIVALVLALALILCACGIISTCDMCGKTFPGKGYYGVYGPDTLCDDCAKTYDAPFPYKNYAN